MLTFVILEMTSQAHVQEGNVAVLAEHGSRALFLCYPPPADESVGCMSAQCLQHYKGDTLVYVGEGKGKYRRTALTNSASTLEDFRVSYFT